MHKEPVLNVSEQVFERIMDTDTSDPDQAIKLMCESKMRYED